MRSLRSRPAPGHRRTGHRVTLGVVALAAAVTVSACTAFDSSNNADTGPPRLTPHPEPDVAAAMINSISAPGTALNACTLLNVTTEEIMDLTGTDMPDVDPIGSGDLGTVCIYGGPGSPERAAAELASPAETESDSSPATTTNIISDADASPAGTAGMGAASETSETSNVTTSPVFDPEIVPDTFAAGVVKPRGGAGSALAEQATLLGVRYACSAIRGAKTTGGEVAPGAPEAPAPVDPELPTSYIDCAAAPTGGGIEVHTILVADNDLWHLVLLGPETPRSPEAEAEALAGLHRVGVELLS